MAQKCVCILLVSLSLIILKVGPVHSFQIETRRSIVEDAIKFCPSDLKSYLIENKSTIKKAMAFVDLDYEIDIEHEDVKIMYLSLVNSLKADRTNDFETAREFGLLSCYLAEIINPTNKGRFKRVPQASEDEKIIM